MIDPNFFESHSGLWNAASAGAAWLFGLIALAINVFGLIFVWRQLRMNELTLKATAESAAAAAEAARISYVSSRPWLNFSIKKAYLYFNPDNPTEIGCQIDYSYKNVGQTPAVQVGVVYRPVPSTAQNRSLRDEFLELFQEKPFQPHPLFPGESIEQGLSRNFPFPPQPDERFLGFRIVAAVVYKANTLGETYWTPIALALQITEPPTTEHFFRRGMGNVECLVMRIAEETPDPT
jgi:hypothetical protein